MKTFRPEAWLPTTKKEVEARGWDYIDVILFSGDAYVDHPSFGAAVIGRTLEALGLRVAIVPQPDWRGDYRDFKKLGTPRLFFGVSPGAMDSMINHYTANKRLRSDDAYTPDRRAGMRPDYPSIVYTKILKELYPDVPVVLGGIEASLRRLSHDYWQDRLRPGILADSPADLLIYGMGELPMKELVTRLQAGESFNSLKDIRQTVYLTGKEEIKPDDIVLFSHEECLRDKLKQAKNFRHIEEESNKYNASRILQQVGKQTIVVNPPFPPMTETEVDASFDLPYTRLPHPKYKGKVIPAFEMIKFSVNMHRGCFGGCAFCTISAHQGKFIASRSKESILKEVKAITEMPDFKGYLSDLGGPSANMYRMKGKDQSICAKCKKPSCISPVICKNLNADHTPLLDIYKAVDSMPQIKRSFIGSGVRYDLLLHRYDDEIVNKSAQSYTEELIARHVSGRLKVAPEHTEDNVLKMMRKPSFDQFGQFKKIFDRINKQQGLNQQLIPYFISSHPGCTEEDMAKLAIETKKLHFQLEQVQDFTPTPMTVATEA
ncbi:YgiQ family radical SAM protein, partial [Parabacteroides goldsteinii]|uniref:YgiQ family radical SAM protein n=1 Tax=Parabacteroides goldsteinii TaxID=328812 RepID=UPI0025710CDA